MSGPCPETAKRGCHEVAAGEGGRIWVWDIKQKDIAALCGCQQPLLPGHKTKAQAAKSSWAFVRNLLPQRKHRLFDLNHLATMCQRIHLPQNGRHQSGQDIKAHCHSCWHMHQVPKSMQMLKNQAQPQFSMAGRLMLMLRLSLRLPSYGCAANLITATLHHEACIN